MNIALVGGGSWGTAIARLLNNNGHRVNFYVRDEKVRDMINISHENSKYLPGVELGSLKATSNLKEATSDIEMLVMAVPTSAFRDTLNSIEITKDVLIVNLAKGIEVGTLMRISEISEEVKPNNIFVTLSGPSHAEEVGLDIPTAVVVSSKDEDSMKKVQYAFSSEYFRVYTNSDLIGVEMGGSLKNVIALACGMCDGLGLGDNSKAALSTRGIYEMSKLGLRLGANPQTFNGLSGIGDLIVTCTSVHSRNRMAGELMGKGMSSEQAALEIGQIVEGVKTTKSAFYLSKKYNISMPITQELYQVIYEGKSADSAVYDLMTRDYKDEIEEIFLG